MRGGGVFGGGRPRGFGIGGCSGVKDALAVNVGLLGTDAESENGEVLWFNASGGEEGVMTAPLFEEFASGGVAVSGGSKGLSMGETQPRIGENTVSEDAVLGLRSMASSGMVSSELRMLSGLCVPDPSFVARLDRRPCRQSRLALLLTSPMMLDEPKLDVDSLAAFLLRRSAVSIRLRFSVTFFDSSSSEFVGGYSNAPLASSSMTGRNAELPLPSSSSSWTTTSLAFPFPLFIFVERGIKLSVWCCSSSSGSSQEAPPRSSSSICVGVVGNDGSGSCWFEPEGSRNDMGPLSENEEEKS